jgi:hypothetical protein
MYQSSLSVLDHLDLIWKKMLTIDLAPVFESAGVQEASQYVYIHQPWQASRLLKQTREAFTSSPFVNKHLRRILLRKLMITYGIPD